jgi:antagonist of KipI
MAIEVLEAAGLVTVQDAGRAGWRGFGVPASGPMDWFAFRAANALAGNPAGAAAIEIGLGDALFNAHSDCVVAVAGAGYEVSTYLWTFPLWGAFFVRGGMNIRLRKTEGGNWAYLAAAGRFETQAVLGSRSAFPRGGLGRALVAGDALDIGSALRPLRELAARSLPVEKRPAYGESAPIEVIRGPQADWFDAQAMNDFLSGEYRLGPKFDRMGYRLEGPGIASGRTVELVSEGMSMGSVQVPADGQPIVMMADGPTTGGYPKIACVASADLPLLAQCEPGSGRIHFKETNVEAAQKKYRELSAGLQDGILSAEDDSAFAQ